MALVELIRPAPYALAATTAGTGQCNATGDRVAVSYIAPKSGTIDRVVVTLSAKTGSPGVLRVGLQGFGDGPINDGSWLASGNGYYDIAAPANGQTTVTLSTPVTVTAGDALCVVANAESGTWNASNRINVAYNFPSIASSPFVLPGPMFYDGATWTRAQGCAALVPLYDDGTYPPGFSLAAVTSIASSWTSSANPLYLGNRFDPVYDCTLRALWPAVRVDGSQLSDFALAVFKDDITTAIASRAVDAARHYRTGTVQTGAVPFGDLLLSAGHAYRFVIQPTSATAFSTAVRLDFPSAVSRAYECGAVYYTTAPSGPGAWTDTDTSVGPVWPEIAALDAGGAKTWIRVGTRSRSA